MVPFSAPYEPVPTRRSVQRERGAGQVIVVDGVQLSQEDSRSALAGLTAHDVRQIDVLEDAASTAIYGVRGSGGVVIITTKR